MRGFPYRGGGHFLRMLYFSAVTITTLGYGDIVPLTTRARTWVTLEIILGPVLFGLFLNSLISERKG
jgi:voltage-gated potassium channel Kch